MDRIRGKNIVAKLMALVLALVLWMYVTNEQNPAVEASIDVPVEARNVASQMVALDTPDTVRVKVRGTRGIIAGLQPQDISAYIDLKGLSEGRQTVKIFAQVPLGLELLEISPDRAQIKIEPSVSRSLPVEIKLIGAPPTGTAVSKAAASPEQITVEGPKSAVESVTKAVVSVDLTGRTADFTTNLPPVPVGKDGREIAGLTIYPDKVAITANILQGLNKKTVDVKTIVYGQPAQGVTVKSVTTKPARIELTGDPQALDKIDFIYTEPINVAGIDRDTEKEVKLQLKEGIVAAQSIVIVQIGVSNSRY
jgi:YbbR domain-containing protein